MEIFSLYHDDLSSEEISKLNDYAKSVYTKMLSVDKRKAKSVAKYFYDIKRTIEQTYLLLKPNGIVVFVIGNTMYKNVQVNNAKYLVNCIHTNNIYYIT